MGWDTKVAGRRAWVMGPKHLLAELLPEYPVLDWGKLKSDVVGRKGEDGDGEEGEEGERKKGKETRRPGDSARVG